jgi:protein CpxP
VLGLPAEALAKAGASNTSLHGRQAGETLAADMTAAGASAPLQKEIRRMSEQTNPSRRRFGFAALLAAALVGLVGGGLASTAFGHAGMGGGFRHWGGHHRHHGPIDPARAKEHAGRMVEHLAWAIDASAEQKTKLTAIAEAMANDLIPVHQKMQGARGRITALLRAPKTDRAALEALRAEHVALADDVSKRIAQGLADAADVLTPQQREKLAGHWAME